MLTHEQNQRRIEQLRKRSSAGKKARANQKRRARGYISYGQLDSMGSRTQLPALIPVRTVSEANAHEHWRARKDRASQQRSITTSTLLPIARPTLPCTIRLTRIGPGVMDSDNAVGSLKHVRDAIAQWLEVDDGPSGPVRWEYGEQERGDFAVRVEVITL